MKLKFNLKRNIRGRYNLEDAGDGVLDNFFCDTFVRRVLGHKPKKLALIVSSKPIKGLYQSVEYKYKYMAGYPLVWRYSDSNGQGYPGLTHFNFVEAIAKGFKLPKTGVIKGTAYLQMIAKD